MILEKIITYDIHPSISWYLLLALSVILFNPINNACRSKPAIPIGI